MRRPFRRAMTLALCAVVLAGAPPARADGLVTIRTLSGKAVTVARSAAGRFSAFLHALEREGYRIDFIGGFRRTFIAGTHVWSQHASGLAIDVNQTARNRVTRRLPRNATALARRYGLTHGAVWHHPDTGHFEIATARRSRHVRVAKRRHQRARLTWAK